jgi:prevent-host-death family protein
MKSVSIQELKRHLSSFIEQAARGNRIIITKHHKPVASLSSADGEHLHVGPKYGRGTITPLLDAPTDGTYLEVLDDDRRPRGSRD